jgi:hypothetical protein
MPDSDIDNMKGSRRTTKHHPDKAAQVNSDEILERPSKTTPEDHPHRHHHARRITERKTMKSNLVPSLAAALAVTLILLGISADSYAVTTNCGQSLIANEIRIVDAGVRGIDLIRQDLIVTKTNPDVIEISIQQNAVRTTRAIGNAVNIARSIKVIELERALVINPNAVALKGGILKEAIAGIDRNISARIIRDIDGNRLNRIELGRTREINLSVDQQIGVAGIQTANLSIRTERLGLDIVANPIAAGIEQKVNNVDLFKLNRERLVGIDQVRLITL